MSLSFAYSPWLLALSVLVAGGLTYWTYRETVPPLAPRWRATLGGLRFLALTLLCLLLFEPVMRQLEQIERPPVLAVLVDDSESVRVTSGAARDTSASAMREAVGATLASLRDAGFDGETRLFAFDRSLRALGPGSGDARGGLDSLRFTGARTDVATALQSLRDELQNENLRGVALISDGQYNTGRNPLYVAERFPVPIHTVTLGDTTRRRDVQIRRVTTNDVAYVDTELPVQVGLKADDAGGEAVTVSLLRDGERVDAADVRLPPGTAEIPVDLTYTPTEAGLQQLTVEVTTLSGEATLRNNRQDVSVRVLERKRRVLVLGAAPSPNVASVRRLLDRDADTEVLTRIPQQGGGFYEGPLPDDLSTIDVFVLAGFPSDAVRTQTIQRVADAIGDDAPVLVLLDRQTDVQRLADAFGDALPVTLEQARSGLSEAVFVPVDRFAEHPVYQIDGAPLDLFERLPPLFANDSRWRATPDARVLATVRVRDVDLDDPLLVVRSRAGRRSAALLATGTWRWSNLPADLNAARPLWPGLLSNLLRWVGTREDDRPVRVRPVEPAFAGGEDVELTGQVYDESMSAVEDASVDVSITAPDSTRYPYTMEPVGNGRYVLDVGVLPEGTYQYTASATRNGSQLGSDRGQFSVGSLTLEYRETRANFALMQQIAERSGGGAFTPATTGDLPQRLAASGDFTTSIVEQEREAQLWHSSLFLAIVLALLAAEWTLRKRFGLV